MIKSFLDNYGLYIYVGLGLIILLIIIICVVKKNKEVEEDTSSILDVNIDGVIDKDFDYGYSKEDTIVIKKEDLKKTKKSKKKN